MDRSLRQPGQRWPATRVAEGTARRAVAVEQVRPPQGSLASAERWLKRRVQWVSMLLAGIKALYPERFTGVEPSLAGFGRQPGSETVMRMLRGMNGCP